MPFCSTALIASRCDLFLVEQLVAFLGHQHGVALAHRHLARLGAAAERLAEHVADIDHADLRAGHAGNLERRHAAAGVGDLHLDLALVELAVAQHLAEFRARFGRGRLADQRVEHAFLGGKLGLGLDLLAQALARHAHRRLRRGRA